MADESPPTDLQPHNAVAAEDRVADAVDPGGTTSTAADLQPDHAVAAGGCGPTSHDVDNTADADTDRGPHRPRSDVADHGTDTG